MTDDSSSRVPTVGIVVINDDKVLLVKHLEGAGHLTGSYGTPGGRIDAGESARTAAARELQEETGLFVADKDLIELPERYTADLQRKNGGILRVYHTVFAATKFEGELTSSSETTPEWVLIAELPHVTLLVNTENMIKQAIHVLSEHE